LLELPFEQVRNENVSKTSSPEKLAPSILRPKGKSSSVTEQPLEKTDKESPAIGASDKLSSLAKSSNPIGTPNISRLVTPTIPSFSQNANVINVSINYGSTREKD
jgi:hypothetical protein